MGIANSQFRIGLNMAKIPLSQGEYDMLVDYFGCKEKRNYMMWKDFSDRVDEVFNIKSLEKNPDSNTIVPLKITLTSREKMLPAETALAEKVIEKFRYFCLATRLYVKQFFQDWDPLGRYKVTPKQFRQVLVTVRFNLSDDEFRAITKYFLTEDGYMDYAAFIDRTTPYQGGPTVTNTPHSNFKLLDHYVTREFVDRYEPIGYCEDGTPKYAIMEDLRVDPNFVLQRIKKAVKTSRIRLKEYLQDFDPLRKGVITANKFFGSLDKLKLHLTENESKALERIYVCKDDKTLLEYSRFIEEIELVFTNPGLEKNPLCKVEPYKLPTLVENTEPLSEAEREVLHSLLTDLANHVRINRVLLKPFFQDSDNTNSGKIKFTRFRSIMDQCDIKLTDDAYNVLSKMFSYQGIEFNYVEFDKILKEFGQEDR